MLSIEQGTLTLEKLAQIANEVVLPTLGEHSLRRELIHVLAIRQEAAASGADDPWEGDCLVHEGDWSMDGDFSTRDQPTCSLLIVTGNLTVSGLLEITLDPDALLIVMGDLHADRLINCGFLYVHGDLIVAREAIWFDNDACSLVHGNLSAPFLFTQYHSITVGGQVSGDLIVGDCDRFESPTPHPFIAYDDEEHKHLLVECLPKEAMEIVGDDEEADNEEGDDEEGDDAEGSDEWVIETIDPFVLADLMRDGTPIVTRPD